MLGEELVKFLAVVVAGSLGVTAREMTGDEYSRLPKLFHLDDYNTCLMQSKGLYCLGSFYVKPLNHPDPTYELMKEYSSDRHHFNRTLLHRGYCVSSRCPWLTDRNASLTDRNATLTGRITSRRFERCTSFYAQRIGLRAQLTELSYCRSHAQDVALKDISNSVEAPHRVFLYFMGIIVALNVIGTVYDLRTKSNRKSKLVTSWSLVSSWSQLVGPDPSGDRLLAARLPVEAFRVVMILLVVLAHAGCLHDVLFLQNPKYVEEMSQHPVLMLLQNGSSSIQMFILLSNFLLADSLLNMHQPPSFIQLPKIILKRIFRIFPAYVLVMSFAATWWPLVRDGPMWPMLVGRESEVCKRKFWPNVFFLQNFIEPEESCLWQTWFLAVDLQLHVVGCITTLLLRRRRRLALALLGAGFLLSVALNSYRAYVNHWMPLMFVNMPEHIRTKFRAAPSFSEFYTSPMGSLPTCLLGLFMAHLLRHLRETGFKPADHKWLIIGCQATVPLFPAWTGAGWLLRGLSSRYSMALYIALERPVLTLLAAVLLFGAYNGTAKKSRNSSAARTNDDEVIDYKNEPTEGFLQHVFGWRAWFPLGRLSLAVLLLHWCVNCALVGSRLTPVSSSTLDLVADWISTAFLSYLLAVPLTLMVEIPFQKMYSAIMT